ncbi:MAG: hypothetical protein HQK52_21575 [Oligoflexia bacterium]|nr:hypothetical protein [Oligoflexia bacterium]
MLMIFFSGCAINKFHSQSDRIFPYGTYHQQVHLEMLKQNQTYQFNVLLRLSISKITLVALSPFGLTMLQIMHDKTIGKTTLDIYFEDFKRYHQQILDAFKQLIPLIELTKVDIEPENHIHFGIGRSRLDVYFNDLDATKNPPAGVFRKKILMHEYFKVSVEDLRYEAI